MKKNSRLTALLLALFLLLGSAACSAGGEEETTVPETTASTSAPETTVEITEETTEEAITVVAPPETTTPPETLPPEPSDILRILTQDGVGEALLSALGAEEDCDLLAAREQKLLYEHGLVIELSKTANLSEKVQNDLLAGNSQYDLLLTNATLGVELLASGLLENLSEAGIDITPDSIGIHKSITESLTVGSGSYLIHSEALVSSLTSTYALKYNGASLSSDPVKKVLGGEFTVELMLTYISELNTDAFSLSFSPSLALFTGVGGEIFTKDEKGIPVSTLSADTGFAAKYDAALSLLSSASESEKAAFTVAKLSSASVGEIYLPLPKADSNSQYRSLVDAKSLSLLAAPAGVVGGKRLATLINALSLTSYDYKEAVRNRIVGESGMDGKNMLGIIETSMCLDLGSLLGWGDLDDHIADNMKKGTSAADLLADRMTTMRNKAVETAAGIVADRLGIK